MKLELRRTISQIGISLICYTTTNELKAEEFIQCLNYNIENNITFEEILRSLKNHKNEKIHINQPLQVLSSLKLPNNLPKYKLLGSFIRKLGSISQNNNLSIILKSYTTNSLGNTVSLSNSALYGSNFVGFITNGKLVVQKSRYLGTKEYDLDNILIRSLRRKKLESIEKK